MTPTQRRALVSPEDLAAVLGKPPPTAQQSAVISAPAEPTLVIAGAGSGKTETIAQRVVYLVANGLARPGDVLGLTFTRKAAGELAARIRARLRAITAAGVGDRDALLESAHSNPEISTYHAFAGTVIAEFGPLVGIEPAARVLTPTATWQLARDVVRRWDGDLDIDRSPERVTQEILDISSALADHLADLEAMDDELRRVIELITEAPPTPKQKGPIHSGLKTALESLAARRAVLPLVRAFVHAKRAVRGIDFADQMQLAARIVALSSRAGDELRARYPLVFLDEYQDTGHSQRIILRGLFGCSAASPGSGGSDIAKAVRRGHAVTAVGDPVQSIYSWRGASASNLQRFVTDFPMTDGTPARQRELLISFRNDRAVLDLANSVSGSVRHAPVAVGTLEPAATAADGVVDAALLLTVDDENNWLADKLVDAWHSAGDPPTAAVLVRRRASMAAIAQALRARGLPVEVVGVGGLIDEPEVADIIAMLRLLVDHRSGPAAVRILTGARWRLGIFDIAALARRGQDLSAGRTDPRRPHDGGSEALTAMRSALADVIGSEDIDEAGLVDALADPGESERYSAEGWRRIGALSQELNRLRAQLSAPLTELLRDIERALRLDVEVLLSAAGRAHLDAFANIVAGLAETGMGPVEVLDYLDAASDREDGLEAGNVDVADGRIQILTVHAAKGLEWDIVAIPHLSEGVFPSSMNSVWLSEASLLPPSLRGDRDDIPVLDLPPGADQGILSNALKEHRALWKDMHLVEERRLFYVAVTRAKHRVLLSAHQWGATRKEPAGPGEFFKELVECSSGDDAGGEVRGDTGSDAIQPTGAQYAGKAGSREATPQQLLLPEVCAQRPAKGVANPLLGQPVTGVWPMDPLGNRRARVDAAAQRVRQALADLDAPAADAAANRRTTGPVSTATGGPVTDNTATGSTVTSSADTVSTATDSADTVSTATDNTATGSTATDGSHRASVDGEDPEGWFRDMRLLLAERAAASEAPPVVDVDLPSVLPVSTLVQLAADPDALARRIRRPLPQAPAPQARRGTAFHAWLERYFGGEPLLDMSDLPGAHDLDAAGDSRLDQLIAAFRASPWATRTPIAVEVPFVTHVAGIAIRGRIDAVFADADGGVCVVDWKTGVPPGPDRAGAVATQLVAYRLAWARLHAMPLEKVRAAFYYVAYDRTVTPGDLMGADALEQLLDRSVTYTRDVQPDNVRAGGAAPTSMGSSSTATDGRRGRLGGAP